MISLKFLLDIRYLHSFIDVYLCFLLPDKVVLSERPLRNAFLVCQGKSQSVPGGKLARFRSYLSSFGSE